MTVLDGQLAARVQPLSSSQRYRIATTTSLAIHAVILLAVGLWALRAPLPARPEVLIPIELTVSGQPEQQMELGGGGQPEARAKPAMTASVQAKLQPKPPSSAGGPAKAAPAPPRILTSRKGVEPSGPVGRGREAAGPGGQADVPAGPTQGPGLVGGPTPVYPKDALDEGLEGTVSLAVAVAGDGSVTKVTVAKSSGHRLLDEAALRALKRGWAFQPALKSGKPTAGTITVTFVFTSGEVRSQ
jgi:periplasmic protein TonB